MNGIWMVYDTAGRGVGAAGYRKTLFDPGVPFGNSPRQPEGYAAHNLWVQVASEYGIFVAGGLLALLGSIGLLGFRAKRRGAPPEVRILGIVTLVGLVGYLFYGVVTGSPIRHAVNWMFFATLVVMAANLYQARAAPYAARIGANRRRPLGPGALATPRGSPGAVGREAVALRRSSP